MTFTPTHISLEGILLWSFIPSSEKKRFQQNKLFFWIVLAFSLIPDLDIFLVGQHRGLAHSMIIPLILSILGTLIYYHYHYSDMSNGNKELNEFYGINRSEKYSFIGRCVLYAGILWLVHIFLDWEYPLAIFYPLSDRLYQFNFTIFLDVMPWFIFPSMIVGLGFKITGISYLSGLTTFFTNLTPETRVKLYGEAPVEFPIDDFFIHVLLFIIFLVYVARPMTPTIKLKQFSDWSKDIQFDGPILGLGIILIVIGLNIGPMIGTHTTDSDSISSDFEMSTSVFSPTIALTFDTTNYFLQPSTIFHVEGTLVTDSDNSFDHVVLVTTEEEYDNFSTGVSDIFTQFPPNTSDNHDAFETEFQNLLDDLYGSSLAMNLTNFNETKIETKLLSGSYAIMAVIENWNSSLILDGTHLSENAELEVIISSSRITLLVFGFSSIILGIVVTVISVRVKKRE
ncbi:MAG: metal-dependent hydrolase [Candidatus Heimdallarchaeota archaeon]|nr:MAG: metal-dependent hydrolase [Candidatus Heimdallarchaeota archaeon]